MRARKGTGGMRGDAIMETMGKAQSRGREGDGNRGEFGLHRFGLHRDCIVTACS